MFYILSLVWGRKSEGWAATPVSLWNESNCWVYREMPLSSSGLPWKIDLANVTRWGLLTVEEKTIFWYCMAIRQEDPCWLTLLNNWLPMSTPGLCYVECNRLASGHTVQLVGLNCFLFWKDLMGPPLMALNITWGDRSVLWLLILG